MDIAVDLSRVTRQVYLSTRRGAWIISKMGPLGYPADALANSRLVLPCGVRRPLCLAQSQNTGEYEGSETKPVCQNFSLLRRAFDSFQETEG